MFHGYKRIYLRCANGNTVTEVVPPRDYTQSVFSFRGHLSAARLSKKRVTIRADSVPVYVWPLPCAHYTTYMYVLVVTPLNSQELFWKERTAYSEFYLEHPPGHENVSQP